MCFILPQVCELCAVLELPALPENTLRPVIDHLVSQEKELAHVTSKQLAEALFREKVGRQNDQFHVM